MGRAWPGTWLLLVTLAACARVPGQEVPDVRTPLVVVNEMLRLGAVTADDVVYDLGSGDGRIVIAAARDRGARGVGFEIDPALGAQAGAPGDQQRGDPHALSEGGGRKAVEAGPPHPALSPLERGRGRVAVR